MNPGKIEIIEQVDSETFRKKYLLPQIPVVVKRIPEALEAVRKWDTGYIEKVCGDVNVDVYDNAHDNSASAFTTPDLRMKFSEYFGCIKENRSSLHRIFLFNMFKHRPELRKDFPCPTLFNGILGKMGFMFFGAKDIKVRIHQDMDMSNVLLTQFQGKKHVLLVAPKYSTLLYRLPFNTHSLVDLDKPDFVRFPGLKHIETLECVLEPGDTLFMPSGYWHYITYIDAGFSVSYRKMAQSPATAIQGMLNVLVLMPLDKAMNFLFGNRWFNWKIRKAHKRAGKEISRKESNSEKEKVTSVSLETN